MQLRMEKAIYGGAGLGRAPADAGELAGKAVFVPLALPGELVDATVSSNRRGYITAGLERVLEPASFRIQPGCVYYQRCGGCHYQHSEYAAQLEMKRAILAETLSRAHVTAPAEIRTLAAEPWGYRNRIRLHVTTEPVPALCYREAASHRDLAVDHCPVAAPILQQAIGALTRRLQAMPELAARLREAEFFATGDESALLMSLFPHGPLAQKELGSLCDSLQQELPALRGARASSSNAHPAASAPGAAWGDPALDYAVGGRSYRVSAGAFFQVNRFLVAPLLEAVAAGRSGGLAWDLYAGVGLFAKALAEQFERVIAVESSPLSTPDLRKNLRGGDHQCVSADALQFLRAQTARKQRQDKGIPDLIVVDPPRAGLGADSCKLLASARPRQIAYVSCDPATLARDLRALQLAGYRLTALTLVDLFPQTFHLETVAVLERV
jgi:23S rRNA (uracil1939-C5)-methyltransferase